MARKNAALRKQARNSAWNPLRIEREQSYQPVVSQFSLTSSWYDVAGIIPSTLKQSLVQTRSRKSRGYTAKRDVSYNRRCDMRSDDEPRVFRFSEIANSQSRARSEKFWVAWCDSSTFHPPITRVEQTYNTSDRESVTHLLCVTSVGSVLYVYFE